MKTSQWTLGVVLVSFAIVGVPAEEPAGPPQPTAQHEEMAMWVGTWAGSGEMKPGPFGPGGPMTWTEKCDWFEGSHFHVVCRSEGSGPMGPSKGLGIMGYDPEKQVYTHYGIDTNGWVGHSAGTREGKTWTYRSEETMGGQTYHSRMTMTLESPTRLSFTWAMSEDGENWTPLMEGTTEKQ